MRIRPEFPIGSISKMFIGLAVLKLVEEGKLNLKDKVRELVPEIKFKNKWQATNPVLLVHLLEHTSGWGDMTMAELSTPISLNPVGHEILSCTGSSLIFRFRPSPCPNHYKRERALGAFT